MTSVLVAGATGTQGGAVANALLESDDFEVHALTRDPESEAARELSERGAAVVEGDLNDSESIKRAVEGMDAAFGVTDYFEHGKEAEVQQGRTLATAANRADLDQFVFSSADGADRDTGLPQFESKGAIEQHVRDLDLPATIVRPTYLMQNFRAMRSQIADGTLPLGLSPETALPLLDVTDLGAFVREALRDPETYAGEAVELAGDELTLRGMAVRCSVAADAPVEAVSVPIDNVRNAMGDDIADMFAWFEEDGFEARPDAVRSEHPVEFTTFEAFLAGASWIE